MTAEASGLIRAAGQAATALGRVGTAGTASARGVANSSNQSARAVASSAQRMSGSAREIGSSFQTMGGSVSSGFGKVAGLATGALGAVAGVRAISSAFKSTVQAGMDFQSTINNLGAVTGSTGAALATVSAKARALGNDIDLPAASASDAAQAMLELAKGGLTVKQSMDAAKGTLTLAAAAQISGADAATIQSAALNTFGLSADKAGHVADVLANTANAASGEITDFAQGLAQSGSVAAGFGISLDDTATVLGLFANNGIKGSDAGTSFKTMLTQLAAPTNQAKQAMETLGLSVYDANGNFVGAEALTEQLAKAQGHLTQAQFNSAAATVFGTDAIRGANILAKEGTAGYDSMAAAVTKAGGAQQVASAQTKGLKGALGLVKNAIQDVQLNAFDTMGPALEAGTRKLAAAIPGIAEVVLPVFNNIVESATGAFSKVSDVISAFGPDNVTALAQGGLKVKDAVFDVFHEAFSDQTLQLVSDFGTQFVGQFLSLASDVTEGATKFITPVIAGASTLVSKALPYVTSFVSQTEHAIGTAVTAIEPLGKSIGNLFTAMSKSGVLDTFGTALTGVGTAAQGAANLLTPVVGAASGVLNGFADLPGQVQGPLLALVATFALSGPLGRIGTSIKSAMQTAYLNTLYGIDKIKAGMAAGMAGIGASLKGMLAAFGGPLGLAIVGVTTFLSFLPQLIGGDNDAANAAQNHASAVNSLATAFQDSNGVIDENVRKTALAQLQSGKWGKDGENTDLTLYADRLKSAGGSTRDLVDAMLGVPGAAAKVESAYQTESAALQKRIDDARHAAAASGGFTAAQKDEVDSAAASLKILREQHAGYQSLVGIQGEAITKAKDNAEATRETATAVGTVGTALDALPKGTVFSDMTRHADAAAGAFGTAATSIKTVGQAARDAAVDTSAFFTLTPGKEASDPAVAITRMSTAFDKYNAAVSAADTTSQLFIFTMDKLAGRNVSVEDAMTANASAARAIGKAYRDSAATAQAYVDAQAKLKDDKGHLNDGTDKATNAAQIAADERAVADAYDATKDSVNGLASAATAYQKTAVLRVAQVATDINTTKGFSAAVAASRVEMQRQRDQFIAQQPAADIASGAAARLADKYGLIPKNIVTVMTADPRLAQAAFTDVSASLAKYHGQIDKMPKDVKTLFTAEVAAAESNGKHLYQVYDKTTGNYTAQFLTPNEAAARQKAGEVKAQYDTTKGTWTANLKAVDDASSAVHAVQTEIDALHDKTVFLTVKQIAAGSSSANAAEHDVGLATGGQVRGPGSGTSDSIPAMLSDGEFVVKAAQTAKYLPLLHAINSGTKGYAAGGFVNGSKSNTVINKITNQGDGAAPVVSSVTGLFDRVNSAAATKSAAAEAAFKAAAAAAAAIPAASSAGVEQWRALATKVALAHGENLASVQVMLNQMARESSGNPAAINLTDINAQQGHPSVGLLQFIPGTFAANADPGFSSNIYDPESQMRAWYNYINRNYGGYVSFGQRGYGAYAAGGQVRGKGSGTSDSNLALVSDGEFIVNANSTAKNLPLLQAINKYATGGLVGTLTSLSGQTRAAAGPELSQVVQALQDIASAVADARAAANDKQSAAVAARDNLVGAQGKQQQNLIDYTAKLTEAQHILASETSKTSARTKALDKQRVTDAEAALAKVKAADKASVGKASREYSSALRTAQSYANVATQAERFQKTQQRAYQIQSAYAARVDYFTTKLGAATDKLSTLRADKASMASGIASTVSGFDGGILGHPDTRNTFATILKGQQYDQDQAQKFNLNITKLSKLGLSNSSLQQIASAGVDGGGSTAAALAGATKAQIAQLNGVISKIQSIGGNVGNVVAGQFYDAGIQAATGLVKGLQSQIGAIQKVMNGIAQSVVDTLTAKLKIHSPSKVMHDLGRFIPQGLANGISANTGSVSTAVGNMMAIPEGVNMAAVRSVAAPGGATAPVVQLSINTSDPLVMAVAKMMDLRINGVLVDLEQSFDKVGSQS